MSTSRLQGNDTSISAGNNQGQRLLLLANLNGWLARRDLNIWKHLHHPRNSVCDLQLGKLLWYEMLARETRIKGIVNTNVLSRAAARR